LLQLAIIKASNNFFDFTFVMEGLRHSLLAPAGATVVMIFLAADAMKTMVVTKYSIKDDNEKLLFPHPFAPWTPVGPKYEKEAGKALRAYRMFEMSKSGPL